MNQLPVYSWNCRQIFSRRNFHSHYMFKWSLNFIFHLIDHTLIFPGYFIALKSYLSSSKMFRWGKTSKYRAWNFFQWRRCNIGRKLVQSIRVINRPRHAVGAAMQLRLRQDFRTIKNFDLQVNLQLKFHCQSNLWIPK